MEIVSDRLGRLKPKVKNALDILAAGGHWEYALRMHKWSRREMFTAWLVDGECQQVEGFGMKTFLDMKDASLIARDPSVIPGSTWREVWLIRNAGVITHVS